MRGAALLLLLLVACGDDLRPPPLYQSGTRLRAHQMVPADGEPQWDGWFDTARDEACVFRFAADGAMRCLPSPASGAPFYTDAACTDAVAVVSAVCEPARYAWIDESACGGAGYVVREVGAEVATPTTQYARVGDGSCLDLGPGDPDVRYLSLGAEVPPAGLVRGELIETVNGNLRQRVIAGEDGSRQPSQLVDAAGVPLYWSGTHFAPSSPELVVLERYYADDACTERIACRTVDACAPQPIAYVSAVDEETCPAVARYAHAGATIEPRASDGGGSCAVLDAEARADLICVTVGDTLPDAAFPAVEPIDVGDGRIKARFEGVVGGHAAFREWHMFYDAAIALPCYPLYAADRIYRCLPTFFLPYANVFEDAACTVATAWQDPEATDRCTEEPLPLPPMIAHDDDDDSGCGNGHFSDRTRHLYRIDEILPPAATTELFTRDASGACVFLPDAGRAGDVYDLDEHPATDFVAIDQEVE